MTNQHQTWTRTEAGTASKGAECAPAPAVGYCDEQDWPPDIGRAGFIAGSKRTCRAVHAVRSFPFRSRRLYLPPVAGRGARGSDPKRFPRFRAYQFQLRSPLSRQADRDLSKHASEPLRVTSLCPEHSEPRRPKSWKTLPARTAT